MDMGDVTSKGEPSLELLYDDTIGKVGPDISSENSTTRIYRTSAPGAHCKTPRYNIYVFQLF